MNTDQIVDSKVTTMTDLSGKKSKVLLLKNEIEIEAFKKQLRLYSVVQAKPEKASKCIRHNESTFTFKNYTYCSFCGN